MKPKRIIPKLIVFDFDGVLTDNRVLVVQNAGLVGKAVPPATWKKEWFTKINPSGDCLRMISQVG
jgi:hypothetical protein